jgi:hypothetical protein
MPSQPVKTAVIQVKPRNPFDVLADSDSEPEPEPEVTPAPIVASVAPVVPPYTPTTPPYAPVTPPYGPVTPPYGPVTPPFGPVPVPVAVSVPVVVAPKVRRKGKVIHQVSEDGWVSIRSSAPAPQAPQFVLDESEPEPEIQYERRVASPCIASDEEIEITPLAPPQTFPSLLTRGRIPNRELVLEGKIDTSDEASARAWAEKISKSLKEAEANRGMSFFRRG